MLNTLYNKILTILQKEFSSFQLDASNFGVLPVGDSRPYFRVEGKVFLLNSQKFKRMKDNTLLLDKSESFVIGSNSNNSFSLANPIAELTSIGAIEKDSKGNEQSVLLENSQYQIEGNTFTLNTEKNYTQVNVTYKYLGVESVDRFKEKFSVKIYESDPSKLEQYTLLTLPALWAGMEEILEQKIKFASETIRCKVSFNDLAFESQETIDENGLCAQLNFQVAGMITFVKVKTDGYYPIEEIEIPLETPIDITEKGISFGFFDDE